MPIIPIRDYFYLGAILVIALGLAWWHHSAVLEGEAKVHRAEAKAIAAQQVKDEANAKATVDGLKTDLAELRRRATLEPVSVTPVRLCSVPHGLRTPPAPPGVESGPAPAGSVPGVREGAGDGPDIGASLRRLARSAELTGVMDRACLRWARGISK